MVGSAIFSSGVHDRGTEYCVALAAYSASSRLEQATTEFSSNLAQLLR